MSKIGLYERIVKIPINKIELFISRERDPEIREKLKNSIKTNGLIMPITVVKKKNGKFQLVKGEGRILAHKDLRLPVIKAFVFEEGELSEREIIQNWLIENEVRERMSDLDKVRLMKAEYEIERSISKVAEKFKMRPGTAKQYIKTLEETSESVLDMVEKKEITFTKAKEIGAASKTKSTQEAIARVVAEDKLNQKDTRIIIKSAQDLEKKRTRVTVANLRASLRKLREEVNVLKPVVATLQRRYDVLVLGIVTLIKNKNFVILTKKEGIDIPKDMVALAKEED